MSTTWGKVSTTVCNLHEVFERVHKESRKLDYRADWSRMFNICLVVIIVEEPLTTIEKYYNLRLQSKALHITIIINNNNDKYNSWAQLM